MHILIGFGLVLGIGYILTCTKFGRIVSCLALLVIAAAMASNAYDKHVSDAKEAYVAEHCHLEFPPAPAASDSSLPALLQMRDHDYGKQVCH